MVTPFYSLKEGNETISWNVFNSIEIPWMNNCGHGNKRYDTKYYSNEITLKDLCKSYTVAEELLKLQPSISGHYQCRASVLGDYRHSDWIMVILLTLLTFNT